MNAIGIIGLVLFVIGWAAGIVAWFYGAYHLLIRFFKRDKPEHTRKAIKGLALFVACFVFAFSNGLIAAWFGGWHAALLQ